MRITFHVGKYTVTIVIKETHLSQGHDFLHYHIHNFITTFLLTPVKYRSFFIKGTDK